jgi:hypothetical protein
LRFSFAGSDISVAIVTNTLRCYRKQQWSLMKW